VATDLGAIAEELFAQVMAPLVLGGPLRPTHAIGARSALALGEGRIPADRDLASRVEVSRVRRARRLVAVDVLPDPSGAEWAMAAAINDVLQSTNPAFDRVLRRGAAVKILASAAATLERVPAPPSVRDALSRHTWFARVLETTRTDTRISWWTGSRTYLGVEPPSRLQAWPGVRRVRIAQTPRPLLDLSPIAVDRLRLGDVVARLLSRTPFTDLSTCARTAPVFAWNDEVLSLVGTRAGRTIALRALAMLPPGDVDTALGRATRTLLGRGARAPVWPAISMLAERAVAAAEGHAPAAPARGGSGDGAFARALGALVASQRVRSPAAPWSAGERARLLAAMEPHTQSVAAKEAEAMLQDTAHPPRPVRA
jgi:hypothetical protein